MNVFTQPVLKIKRSLRERWYVEYKLQNQFTKKWVQRKEYGNINRLKTREERKAEGEALRCEILSNLEKGIISLNPKITAANSVSTNLTVVPAIEEFLKPHLKAKKDNQKKTGVRNDNSTYDTYRRYLSYFVKYCGASGLIDQPLNSYKQKHIRVELIEWLQLNKDWKEQSKKNFFTKVKQFFKYYHQKGIVSNDITNYKVKFIIDTENNEPFTEDDLDNIIPYMRANDPYLLLYCQFIYYMFLRPLEVIKLKVGMIDLEKAELHLSPEIQKVKRKTVLHIPEQLIIELKKMRIGEYDPNDFVISKLGYPSKITITRSCFYCRLEKVLKKFDLWGQNKGLYSFKHTGVIHLWNHMEIVTLTV